MARVFRIRSSVDRSRPTRTWICCRQDLTKHGTLRLVNRERKNIATIDARAKQKRRIIAFWTFDDDDDDTKKENRVFSIDGLPPSIFSWNLVRGRFREIGNFLENRLNFRRRNGERVLKETRWNAKNFLLMRANGRRCSHSSLFYARLESCDPPQTGSCGNIKTSSIVKSLYN